jgi:membrane protease YdiL (CAAX protease family)
VKNPVAWAVDRLFIQHWKAIDEEADKLRREQMAAGHALGYPWWRPLIVLSVVAVSLTIQEYWGDRNYFARAFDRDPDDAYWTLKGFGWWSGWRFIGYVVMPVVAIWLMRGDRVRDYYVSLRGFFKHLWIYVVLFLLILPAVIIASLTESFYLTYPFYKLSNRSAFDLWAWQAMYAVQFVSLEFFFRGFLLHGLREMGSKAIFVMIVPYCMIHFGKPWTETLGAIGAGIILGTLAMRTRSIWGGVFIHIAVAVTMDLLALRHCPAPETGMPCRGH